MGVAPRAVPGEAWSRIGPAHDREATTNDEHRREPETAGEKGWGAISAGQRLGRIILDTEEVRSSNPLAPTRSQQVQRIGGRSSE